MFKNRLITIYSIFLVLIILGIGLNGTFDDKSELQEISGIDILLSLMGFFIILSSIVGALVIFFKSQQMSEDQKRDWKLLRYEGKSMFIRTFIVKISSISAISMFILLFKNYLSGIPLIDGLKNYGIIFFIIIAGTFFIAFKFWDRSEQEYKSLSSAKQQDPAD